MNDEHSETCPHLPARPSAGSRRSRIRRAMRVAGEPLLHVLVVVLTLVGLPWLVWYLWTWRAEVRWERAVAAARARGEPVELEDLVPTLPAEENAETLIREVGERFADRLAAVPRWDAHLQRLNRWQWFRRDELKSVDDPSNELGLGISESSEEINWDRYGLSSGWQDSWDMLRGWTHEEHEEPELFEILKQAAQRPRFARPVSTPYLPHVRQYFSLRFLMAFEEGDFDRAFETVLIQSEIAAIEMQEWPSGFTAFPDINTHLKRLLSRTQLSAEQSRAIDRSLARCQAVSVRRGYLIERVIELHLIQQLAGGARLDRKFDRYRCPFYRALVLDEQRYLLEMSSKYAPLLDSMAAASDAEVAALGESPPVPSYFHYASDATSGLDRALLRIRNARRHILCLRLSLRAAAAFRRQGAVPPWEELLADDELPDDDELRNPNFLSGVRLLMLPEGFLLWHQGNLPDREPTLRDLHRHGNFVRIEDPGLAAPLGDPTQTGDD